MAVGEARIKQAVKWIDEKLAEQPDLDRTKLLDRRDAASTSPRWRLISSSVTLPSDGRAGHERGASGAGAGAVRSERAGLRDERGTRGRRRSRSTRGLGTQARRAPRSRRRHG